MKVLVLGGYGLIGAAIVRTLQARGHEVAGLGRSAALGRRLLPGAAWRGADIAALTSPQDWSAILAGAEVVVNASGALQDGARDSLEALHARAVAALVRACETAGVRRLVQISAPGARADAPSAFLRTKATGDAAVRASGLDWIIFKPGLVISANAYGGAALLRALAAFPAVQPLVFAESQVQSVAIADVADAVARAVDGAVESRRDYDLVEDEARSFASLVAAFRQHLGFAPARATLPIPAFVAFALSRLADAAGWFGWRSPARTTALRAIRDGVIGDPRPWRAQIGQGLRPLEQALAAVPATLQERVFARAALVYPVLVAALAAFWIASGLIGFARQDAAAALFAQVSSAEAARTVVLLGSAADVAIGVALLARRFTRAAAFCAILLSLAYLAAATMLAPSLWLDPLGPMVKVIPALALALAAAALTEER